MRSAAKRRPYDLRVRAARAEQRRDGVIDVATDLFMRRPYEEVTLQKVAAAAGVALKTVVRQFGSKDALFLECVRRRAPQEEASRRVDVGDVAGAARVLAARYEELADMTMRFLPLESRFESVSQLIEIGRASHLEWLARVFSPWLPERDRRERRKRLAQLFGATEIYVWWVWRNRLGMDRRACEDAMRGALESLIAGFEAGGR